MTTTPSICFEARDEIGFIQLDDGKANAMRTESFEALHAALDQAESCSVKALVLRGRQGIFSGGLDLKFLPTLDAESAPLFSRAFAETMLRVWTFPTPTVAQVTGHAIAGGCVLASACDRRVGLDGAFRYQMNEHWIGIDLPSWMRAILATAWTAPALERLLLMGETFSPEGARSAGMLHDLASDVESLSATTDAAAAFLANLHTANVASYKRRFREPTAKRVLEELDAS